MAEGGFGKIPEYAIDIEPCDRHIKVIFNGETVADSSNALILRETRLEPTYYLPRADVRMDWMQQTDYFTHCPFKGNASYWTLTVGGETAENVLWGYEDPLPEAAPLKGYVAFYRDRMDAWHEDDEPIHIDSVSHTHGNPLVDWLLRDAWEASSVSELTARLARQLRSVGVPVFRINLLVRTLHPQVMGTSHLWSQESDLVEERQLSHANAREEVFQLSPLLPVIEGRGGVRRRLEGPDALLDYPILRELRDAGATDYAAMPLTFSDGQIHVLTLASNQPGGFATQNLGHVHEILPLVSRLVEVHATRRLARSLLDTYLGPHTGERVLEGLIQRGDGEEISAVIWWADLRGSTSLAERLSRADYLGLLNEFFEATAGPVLDGGGEVLKFIGDAVMAIFPSPDPVIGAERALSATREALTRVARLQADRHSVELGVAIALHHGDVHYGNVGESRRLDFTVTGPAVNEVARIEGLSKQLGHSVLASESFARLAPSGMVSLGRHALRGVGDDREVFTLRDA
jgi:class 3 adenylate cyclase/uncharacterized protein (DUF427 family)